MIMSFNTLERFSLHMGQLISCYCCIIDGCPPLIQLNVQDIQKELDRRKPGQSKFTTQRKESDKVQIYQSI